MPQEIIDIGLYVNDPNADNLREGGEKINGNFDELYEQVKKVALEVSLGVTDAMLGGSTVYVAERMNARTTTVNIRNTPVFVSIANVSAAPGGSAVKYVYLFKGGPGVYGIGGTTVTALMFTFISSAYLTPSDVLNDPDAIIDALGTLPDGSTFVGVANESVWNFTNSGTETDTGVIQRYFSFSEGGKLKFALFTGTAGSYGDNGNPFTDDMFVVTTDDTVVVEKTKLSEFNNDVPFVKDTDVIKTWVAGSYKIGQIVKRVIDGMTLLFQSNADDNNTVPSVRSELPAWSPPPYGGTFVAEWVAGSYTTGQVVSRSGWVYYCLTNNSSDPKLLTPPDWLKLGKWMGGYDAGTTYATGDVVIDTANAVYISNYNLNNYALNKGVISKWSQIGQFQLTIVANGDSLTFGTGSSGRMNYPAILSDLFGYNFENQGVSGETSTQIKTRFNAAPERWKLAQLFWVGRNNYGSPETVKADIAEMISKLPHNNYLVIGIIKATSDDDEPIDTLNADLAALYGDRFVDMQSYLVGIYDVGNAQDVADHAAGHIAGSLRSDWLHLNNTGYSYAAKLIASRINYLFNDGLIRCTDVQAQSVHVTGNVLPALPGPGMELFYIGDKGFIQAYDRKAGVVKDLSISYTAGAKTYIAEQGGEVYTGEIGTPEEADVLDIVVRASGSKRVYRGIRMLNFTEILDFADVGSHAVTTLTFEAEGLNVGDPVEMLPPLSMLSDADFFSHVAYRAWVSADDEITALMINTSALSVVLPSGEFNFRILKQL